MMSRKRRGLGPRHVDGRERAIEVAVGQIEIAELELGRSGRLETQRIDVREEVPAHAVGVDELADATLNLGHRHRRGDRTEPDGFAARRPENGRSFRCRSSRSCDGAPRRPRK